MTTRRSRGDGGLHWDEARQRWIASVTVGYTPAGKRIVKKASGKTKTAAKAKLKQIIRDYEDGLLASATGYTVADAVATGWSSGSTAGARDGREVLDPGEQARHPGAGRRKLVDLTADDVDRWLAGKAKDLEHADPP